MEINEKLETFYRAAIDAANGQSEAILQEYQTSYQESLAEYEKEKQAGWQTRERIAQERVRKEVNREISEEMLRLKKEYHSRQEEKKKELFALVEQKLAEYRKTDAYRTLLGKKIAEAQKLAAGKAFTVYLDPEDGYLKEELAAETGCSISISGTPLGGGIRAVIPSKNVQMDESFAGRLVEEWEKWV